VIKAQSLCTVCKKPTRKTLFNDGNLSIPICSYECERRFLDALSRAEEARVLSHLDNAIARAKRDLKLCWATAGVGILLIVASLLTKIVTMFIPGAFLAVVCAFLTRHFEYKTTKLTSTRQRISL
jgi:hypothetical protein